MNDIEYIRELRARFRSGADFARCLGVSLATVDSWCLGRRFPGDVNRRLLHILGVLVTHSPILFDTIARPAASKGAASTFPPLPSHIKAPRPVLAPEAKRNRGPKWNDDYWYVRTVTREEWEAGAEPAVVDSSAFLDKMTEQREAQYWASLKSYEQRTGRVKPD